MSNTSPTTDRATFFAKARKAFAGAGVALLTTGGGAIGLAMSDGVLTEGETLAAVGLGIGAAAAAFGAVYGVRNATSRRV